MAGMRDLANHIIAVASGSDLPVTNLQVQKVMFFSLGFHLRNHNIDELAIETYDLPFAKWKYGPVVESIYYTFNMYRDNNISDDFTGHHAYEYADWNENIRRLLEMNIFTLVKVSHDLPSWANFERSILNRDYVENYTLEEILRDFSV